SGGTGCGGIAEADSQRTNGSYRFHNSYRTYEEEMPFTLENPHISAALVLGGVFMQFGDPLDFLARSFGVNAKADRLQLAESLAELGGRGMPVAEARGSDSATRFRIEIVGKCEGKMVALCK